MEQDNGGNALWTVPVRVSILVDECTVGGIPDDNALVHNAPEHLANQFTFEFVPWRIQQPDGQFVVVERNWKKEFDVVVLRSPYSYIEDPDLFLQLLKEIQNSGVKLMNPREAVSWNLDKKYLIQLRDEFEISIPKTLLFSEVINTEESVQRLFEILERDELVLKPTCSAGSHDTFLLKKGKISEEVLQEILAAKFGPERTYLIQEFLPSISGGELSTIFIGGELSHVIRKVPQSSDFRVQSAWGGKDYLVDKIPEQANVLTCKVNNVLNELFPSHYPMLYSRIDLIPQTPDSDKYFLMEIELIEPKLWFQFGGSQSSEKFLISLLNKIEMK